MRWDGAGGTSGGGRRAYAYGGTAREGLFLSKKADAGDSIIKSHVVVDRTRGHPLETFDAPSLPRFASSLQPKTTFPKISERTLWALLGAAGGLLAAEPGGVGARGLHLDSARDTRPPESTAALFRCAFRALSVPSDRNCSPRRASAGLVSRRERLGRGGRGVRAVGGDPSGHQRPVRAIDEPRSARPMDTSSTSRGAAGAGEGMDGGAMGRHAAFSPGFLPPERRWDTLRCSCSLSLAARPAGRLGVGLRCVPRGCRKQAK